MNENPYESPLGSTPREPVWSKSREPLWTKSRLAFWALGIGAILLVIALLLPARRGAREAVYRNSCFNNVKQIILALHNYHDKHGKFPPAYTVDDDGNRLHSWRTLILPYLDERALYDTIDLSKPWDDPANAEARATSLSVYQCPNYPDDDAKTTYLGVVGPECFFAGSETRTFADIVDGAQNTIAIVERSPAEAVEWMSPHDSDIDTLASLEKDLKSPHAGGVFLVGYADGHAGAIAVDIDRQFLRAQLTVAGREVLNDE